MDPRSEWGSGAYATLAERIGEAGRLLVERAGVEPGMEVLDVACGTGNASIPAVQAGARVTGLDPEPAMLDTARERAADAMVEVDWVEGDPRELPFEEARFDRVLSAFGHMFAPDHDRVAAELRRACRPGGAIAVSCWTPEGALGRRFPEAARWGSADHLRELLGERAAVERHALELPGGAVEYLLAVAPR